MSGVFEKGADRVFKGEVDWVDHTIRGVLVAADYTPNFVTHEFLSDIPGTSRVGDPVTLTGKTASGGRIDAGDLTFTSVPATDPDAHGLVLYKFGTVDGDSPLLYFFDGKIIVTVATSASTGATQLRVDPLWGPLDNGTVLHFPSRDVTLTANVTAGVRQIPVTSLSGTVPAGDATEALVSNAGFPMEADGTDMIFVFDNGPNRIVRL